MAATSRPTSSGTYAPFRHVGDLAGFRNFLRILAARTGQLPNLADIARDLEVAVNTIRAWLSVLEATWQVIVLRPYHANIGKRLVKTPRSTSPMWGRCAISRASETPSTPPPARSGGIPETAVLAEVVKSLAHRALTPQVLFWRTLAGTEVDVVVETEGKLVLIEVKLSATPPRPGMAASIRTFRKDLGSRAMPGYVVHPGDVRLPLGPGATVLPFAAL